jgi:hypothetical protein
MQPIRPSFSSFEKGDGVGFVLFSMCAHELLNGFHEFSMYSPNMVLTSSRKLCPKLASWNLYNRVNITHIYACKEEFCMGEVSEVSEPFL